MTVAGDVAGMLRVRLMLRAATRVAGDVAGMLRVRLMLRAAMCVAGDVEGMLRVPDVEGLRGQR